MRPQLLRSSTFTRPDETVIPETDTVANCWKQQTPKQLLPTVGNNNPPPLNTPPLPHATQRLHQSTHTSAHHPSSPPGRPGPAPNGEIRIKPQRPRPRLVSEQSVSTHILSAPHQTQGHGSSMCGSHPSLHPPSRGSSNQSLNGGSGRGSDGSECRSKHRRRRNHGRRQFRRWCCDLLFFLQQ